MSGVTYDTGMSIAAESNRRDAWLLHARVLADGTVPVVPAVVLAQAWRGGPQPLLYARLCFGTWIERAEGRMPLGDGGFTDWVAKLAASRKERCFVGALGIEALATVVTPAR